MLVGLALARQMTRLDVQGPNLQHVDRLPNHHHRRSLLAATGILAGAGTRSRRNRTFVHAARSAEKRHLLVRGRDAPCGHKGLT